MSDVTEESDAALWSRARGGDGRAFGALFDRHRDRMLRSASRSLGDPTDAEDAVAATFLELWRRRERVRLVDDSLLPWLFATCGNVVRNLQRSRRRYRAFLARVPRDDDARSAEEVTVEGLEAFDRAREVTAVLSRLSRADAELLTLIGLEELSIIQVAELLGISADATKQRISRARRRARKLDAEAGSGRGAAEGAGV